MDIRKVISEIKEERDRLGQAIEALEELVSEGKPRTGHSTEISGAAAKPMSAKVTPITHGRRMLSPAGRRRISEAQKKRWAAARKPA
jgi:hypothetical protein